MIDTPRTDAKTWGKVVDVNFARQLERELAQANEWLKDVRDSWKAAMDERCDANEQHCTCVPALRLRVRELERELADAKRRLSRVHECAVDHPCHIEPFTDGWNAAMKNMREVLGEATPAPTMVEAFRSKNNQLRRDLSEAQAALREMCEEVPIDVVWMLNNKERWQRWRKAAGILEVVGSNNNPPNDGKEGKAE